MLRREPPIVAEVALSSSRLPSKPQLDGPWGGQLPAPPPHVVGDDGGDGSSSRPSPSRLPSSVEEAAAAAAGDGAPAFCESSCELRPLGVVAVAVMQFHSGSASSSSTIMSSLRSPPPACSCSSSRVRPLTRTLYSSCLGLGSTSMPRVGSVASSGRWSIVPRIASRWLAIFSCCGSEQCISNERITG